MTETVMISGCSRGLGRALAQTYLKAGCRVVGFSRSDTADLQEQYPNSFIYRPIDLSDVDRAGPILSQWFTDLSLSGFSRVILNAGMLSEIRDLGATPLDDLRTTMEVNTWANKMLLDLVLGMKRKPRQVVALSSGASISGSRGWNGYSLSKAALNMLIKLYANEEPEVHFTALAPGLIDTAMQEYLCNLSDDERYGTIRRLKASRNTPKMPRPDEAAKLLYKIIPELMHKPSGAFIDVREIDLEATP